MRAGIASGTTFVVLNLVCIAVVLVASNELWRREFAIQPTTRLLLAVILLLWWPVFRLANNPLSEFLFLALATGSIVVAMATAQAASVFRRAGGMAITAALALAAFKVRTVGVALAPAIVWAFVSSPERLQLAVKRVRAHPALFAMGGLVLLAIAALVLSKSQYVTGDLQTQFGRGMWPTLLKTWGYRLTEFGELTLNAPAGKMPTAVQPIVPVIGAGALIVFAWLFWRRRRVLGPAEVFALGVAGIMFIWPYKDARFWIPVFPILLGLCAWVVIHTPSLRARPVVPATVIAVFLGVGVVGEIYNTRISITPSQFPSRFSDDYLGPAYRAAWGVRPANDTMPVDSTALRLLREYEPRARSR
jgi:hypothetical protein